MAQEWFEPRISGLTDNYPEWLDNWDLFVDELQNNFGPFDESTNVEHELTNLWMKDSQCISECLMCFNSLAVRCVKIRNRRGKWRKIEGMWDTNTDTKWATIDVEYDSKVCILMVESICNYLYMITESMRINSLISNTLSMGRVHFVVQVL